MRARSFLLGVVLAAFLGGCSDGDSTKGGASGSGTGAGGAGSGSGSGSGSGGGSESGSGGGSGSGSSSGSGGMGSGSGGAGGQGGMPGKGIGEPCAGTGECALGLYCDAPGCGAGTCTQKPVPGLQTQKDPVCGCDGATYWNANVAAVNGASVKAAGTCPDGAALKCGANTPCPGGLKCNRQVQDMASCAPSATGTCWGVPLQCVFDGPQAKACSNGACVLECSLVQSQNPWFNDGKCP